MSFIIAAYIILYFLNAILESAITDTLLRCINTTLVSGGILLIIPVILSHRQKSDGYEKLEVRYLESVYPQNRNYLRYVDGERLSNALHIADVMNIDLAYYRIITRLLFPATIVLTVLKIIKATYYCVHFWNSGETFYISIMSIIYIILFVFLACKLYASGRSIRSFYSDNLFNYYMPFVPLMALFVSFEAILSFAALYPLTEDNIAFVLLFQLNFLLIAIVYVAWATMSPYMVHASILFGDLSVDPKTFRAILETDKEKNPLSYRTPY